MKALVLTLTLLGCSSHAVSYGRAELEGGAGGTAVVDADADNPPVVDADTADRIVDAYADVDGAPQSTEDCPGSGTCDTSGYCVACDAAACSARCACFAGVYPDLYAGTGSCTLGGSVCQCERVP